MKYILYSLLFISIMANIYLIIKAPKIFKILWVEFPYLLLMGLSMRIEHWSKRNKKLSRTLSYIFFPIAIIMELIGYRINKNVCLKEIDDSKKTGYEHSIYSMCYHYLTFVSRMNKWKRFISKKWFMSVIEKHRLKLYNYSINDKSKTSYDSFKSHLGMYGYGNVFLGGAVLNTKGSTTIKLG